MKYLLAIIAILIFSFAHSQPLKQGWRSDTSKVSILYTKGTYEDGFRITKSYRTKDMRVISQCYTLYTTKFKEIKLEDVSAIVSR